MDTAIERSFPNSCRPVNQLKPEVPLSKILQPERADSGDSPFVITDISGPRVRLSSSSQARGGSSNGIMWVAADNELIMFTSSATLTTYHVPDAVTCLATTVIDGVQCCVAGTNSGVACFTYDLENESILAASFAKSASVAKIKFLDERAFAVFNDGEVAFVDCSFGDGTAACTIKRSVTHKVVGFFSSFTAEPARCVHADLDRARNLMFVLMSTSDKKKSYVDVWEIEGPTVALRDSVTVPHTSAFPMAVHSAHLNELFAFMLVLDDGRRSYFVREGASWRSSIKISHLCALDGHRDDHWTEIVSYHDCGLTIVVDNKTRLAVLTGRCTPLVGGKGEEHDVSLNISIPEQECVAIVNTTTEYRHSAVLLSSSGPFAKIDFLSDADILVRHCLRGNSDLVERSVSLLGERAPELLVAAAMRQRGAVPETLLRAIDELCGPSVDGKSSKFGPCVQEFKAYVDDVGAAVWNSRLASIAVMPKDAMALTIDALRELNDNLMTPLFVSRGWTSGSSAVDGIVSSLSGPSITATVPLQESTAMDLQAAYLRALKVGIEKASHLCSLVALSSELRVSVGSLPLVTLASAVWSPDQSKVIDFCRLVIRSCETEANCDEVAEHIESLDPVVQVNLDIHRSLLRGEVNAALQSAMRGIEAIDRHSLLADVAELMEKHGCEWALLRLQVELLRAKPKSSSAGILESLSGAAAGTLAKCVPLVLNAVQSREVHESVLHWLLSHEFGDVHFFESATVFAICGSPWLPNVAATLSDSPKEAYFATKYTALALHRTAEAAARFLRLAITDAPFELGNREKCIDDAAALSTVPDPTVREATRILTIQRSLLDVLRKALNAGPEASVKDVIEQTITTLSNHLFDIRQLYIIAEQYREVGGGAVEMEILQQEGDAEERFAVAAVDACIQHPLVDGQSVFDVCGDLLKKYNSNFAPGLPLFFILTALEVHSTSPERPDWPVIFALQRGVTPIDVFEAYRRILEDPSVPQFSGFAANQGRLLTAMTAAITYMEDAAETKPCKDYVERRVKRIQAGVRLGQALSAEDQKWVADADSALEQVESHAMLTSERSEMFF